MPSRPRGTGTTVFHALLCLAYTNIYSTGCRTFFSITHWQSTYEAEAQESWFGGYDAKLLRYVQLWCWDVQALRLLDVTVAYPRPAQIGC